MRNLRIALLVCAAALCAAPAVAASYRGRVVDGKWFQGRIVNNTFGAYDTYVKFDGDRVLTGSPMGGSHVLGYLEDEEIADPHDIPVYDARRGIWWSVTVYNLRP